MANRWSAIPNSLAISLLLRRNIWSKIMQARPLGLVRSCRLSLPNIPSGAKWREESVLAESLDLGAGPWGLLSDSSLGLAGGLFNESRDSLVLREVGQIAPTQAARCNACRRRSYHDFTERLRSTRRPANLSNGSTQVSFIFRLGEDMIIYVVRHCDYCHSSIGKGHRWVCQKIYSRSSSDEAPRYRHYHNEPSDGQSESSWEKPTGAGHRPNSRLGARTSNRLAAQHWRGPKWRLGSLLASMGAPPAVLRL